MEDSRYRTSWQEPTRDVHVVPHPARGRHRTRYPRWRGHPAHAGTASGIFNTSRQIGGALAVAVFGALLASRAGFLAGLRVSLLIAAAVALAAAAVSTLLQPGSGARKGETR